MTDLSDTPAGAIARLDAALQRRGQNVVHHVMASGAPVNPGTACRAFVRGMEIDELAGGFTQADRKVVISPTSIATIAVGSRLMIGTKAYRVESSQALEMAGTVVRHELVVKG